MFGMGYSTIFRSRWMALIWAAGILWGAYAFVGDTSEDGNAAANTDQVSPALNNF